MMPELEMICVAAFQSLRKSDMVSPRGVPDFMCQALMAARGIYRTILPYPSPHSAPCKTYSHMYALLHAEMYEEKGKYIIQKIFSAL